MVLLKRVKEHDFKRYRIRPLNDTFTGLIRVIYDSEAAEHEAQYWAKQTSVPFEIVQEDVHVKSIKVIDNDGKEIKSWEYDGNNIW